MSNILELNCLIFGEDIDIKDIFTIEIADTVTVGKLKRVISDERKLMPNNIGASRLDIYKVSFLIDDGSLKEEVGKFGQEVIDGQGPLLPVANLLKLFSDLHKRHLHVIVKVPIEIPRQGPTPNPLLRLWCYVLGDDPNQIFSVKIAPTESVATLKDIIKERQKPGFDHIPANILGLYSVSIPSTENGHLGSLDKETLPPELLATRILSEVFSNSLAPKHIHIIVDSPDDDPRTAKRRKLNPGEFKWEKYCRDYWNAPLKQSLTVLPNDLVMDESSDDVLPGEPFTECFSLDCIFIRADYLRMFENVGNLHKEKPESIAIVTGQPGIGKTYWVYYAMRRRLGQGKPAFLYINQTFIYISHTCVETVDPRTVDCEDYTWCFVDHIQDPQHLPTIIYTSKKLFPIYVTSPSKYRWAGLRQARMVRRFLMNPWTWAETEKAASLEKYQNLTRDEISDRFINAGPVARICLSFDANELKEWYNERENVIKDKAIDELLQGLAEISNLIPIGAISHKICLVRRTNVEWVYRVGPMSQAVIGLLRTRLKKETPENREKLIQCFSNIPAAGMIGSVFEVQFNDRFTTRIELEAHPMYRRQKKNSGPMKHSYWKSPFGSTPRDYSGSPHKISISPKERVRYGNTKIDVEQDVYYTSASHNHGPIDSLIVHSGCLYLFQFTVSGKDTFEDQIKILDRFNGLPSKEHQYFVFVVPKSVRYFECPHSEGDFLGGNTPYIAHIDLHNIIMSEQ